MLGRVCCFLATLLILVAPTLREGVCVCVCVCGNWAKLNISKSNTVYLETLILILIPTLAPTLTLALILILTLALTLAMIVILTLTPALV